ncbi:MAG: hypothetical protein R6V12_03350 [Candidatus Hydrogenedentota bacterium]
METRIRNAMLAGALLVALSLPLWAQEEGPGETPAGGGPGVEATPTTVPGSPDKETDETGERPSALPDSLDKMIELAQKNSPEVIIAEAQLREAEARLRQAKLEATQRAIELFRDRRAVEIARESLREKEKLYRQGRGHLESLQMAQERLAELEASVASGNAALEMMATQPIDERGRFGGADAIRPEPEPLVRVERPELPEDSENEILQVLDEPLSIEFEDEQLVVIGSFVSKYLGINIVVDPAADGVVDYIEIRDLTLRDTLHALADTKEGICFVIRDSYIFATTEERAMQINAPTIPDTIPLYVPVDSTDRAQEEAAAERADVERQRQVEERRKATAAP